MAAVAGTKGRVAWSNSSANSYQVSLVKGLLANDLTHAEAAYSLQANSRLREIGIDTNMVCNLSCSYCYLADRKESKGRASLDVLAFRFNELADQGVKLFAFIGKEPLADGRALNLLTRLNEHPMRRSFRTGMVTNGTFVTRRLDELLNADPCYIDISLDGSRIVNDQVRGEGAYDSAIEGVDALVRSPLQGRLSTTTVLWDRSLLEFADHAGKMFDLGIPTCFGSPVLNFAISNKSESIAIEYSRLSDLLSHTAARFPEEGMSPQSRQIIFDLPYRYTWLLLKNNPSIVRELQEDEFEALFWHVPNSSVVVKINPFSFSYFRAVRITHDGTVIENMDLAAHQSYSKTGSNFDLWNLNHWNDGCSEYSRKFHEGFLDDHLSKNGLLYPFERKLDRQYFSQMELTGAGLVDTAA